jgi:hypothetical protein
MEAEMKLVAMLAATLVSVVLVIPTVSQAATLTAFVG